MCDLSRYPEAKAKADLCFQVVVSVLGTQGSSADKASPDLVPVITSWSMAHGLATLLLEGKLKDSFGDTRDQREASANRVIAYFSDRMFR